MLAAAVSSRRHFALVYTIFPPFNRYTLPPTGGAPGGHVTWSPGTQPTGHVTWSEGVISSDHWWATWRLSAEFRENKLMIRRLRVKGNQQKSEW